MAAINYAPERTGIGPYVASLSQRLVADGMSVRVHTAAPHYPEWRIHDGYGRWTATSVEDGVRVTRRRHYVPRSRRTSERLISELSLGLRLLTAPTRGDALILVSPALFASLLLLLRVRLGRRRPRTVAWVQDLYGTGGAETGRTRGRLGAWLARTESYFLRNVDDVVVIHDRFKELVVKSGVPEDRVHVIQNWSHVDPPPANVDVEAARREFGWSSEEVVVLHAGNQGVKQGLSNVVEAARIADIAGVDVRFVLLGAGNTRHELEKLARGVHRIQFIDPLNDDAFARALAASDVLLLNELPGVKEMCVPSKLTTYFSTGKPVVAATANGSLAASEIAKSGGGITVLAGDPQALVDAVMDLASDDTLARRLGASGLAYRRGNLSTGAAVAAWEGLLSLD